jgi:hypothetical protein
LGDDVVGQRVIAQRGQVAVPCSRQGVEGDLLEAVGVFAFAEDPDDRLVAEHLLDDGAELDALSRAAAREEFGAALHADGQPVLAHQCATPASMALRSLRIARALPRDGRHLHRLRHVHVVPWLKVGAEALERVLVHDGGQS